MRRILLTVAACLSCLQFFGTSLAQAPDGFEKIYEAPTNVNLGGRWVVADIELYADMAAAQENELRVALVTDVTKFIEETEQDLENWIATHQDRCGERWSASDPLIEFPPGSIRFVVELELEVWNCGLRGRGEPGSLAREAGRIDVTLDPYIEDGKLQARLQSFYVDDREGVSKYLPLEFVARRVVASELDKLNKNPKFYRAPNPFVGEGFEYEAIRGRNLDGDRVVITAKYRASGGSDTLNRLVEAVRRDGITQ